MSIKFIGGSSGELPFPIIAGAGGGAVLFLLIIICIVVCCCVKRSRRKKDYPVKPEHSNSKAVSNYYIGLKESVELKHTMYSVSNA